MRSNRALLIILSLLISSIIIAGFSTDVAKITSQFWVNGVNVTSFFGFLNGSNQVTSSGIADNSIDEDKIIDNAIQNRHIEDMQVGWAEAALDLRDSIRIGYSGSGSVSADFNVADDTTDIKTKSGVAGQQYFLTKTSTGNTAGSGWFVYKSSGYAARKYVVYPASGGGFWVRKEWLENPKIFKYNWISATKSGSTISTIVNSFMQSGEILNLDAGVYTGSVGITWTNPADSLSITGAGSQKTILKGIFNIVNGKSLHIKGFTIDLYDTVTPVDNSITDWLSGARFVVEDIHFRGNGGNHHILMSGDADFVIKDSRSSGKPGTSSSFAIRGCRSAIINNIWADSSDFGITLKSADSDYPLQNVTISNYLYTGNGSALFLQSNDDRPVNDISLDGVVIAPGATRILHSSTYDEGVPEYNGIIENVSISNVVAPYLTGSAFTIDGIRNLSINNTVIDTCDGYVFNAVNGTGVLNWSAQSITVSHAGSGYANAYNGAKYTNINGETRQYGTIVYSKAGIHPLEEYSNGVAEGLIVDLLPLNTTIGSWIPGIELRQPASATNQNSQNTRLIAGGYRTKNGDTYFGTAARLALIANDNANNPNNLWQQFGFDTYYSWSVGQDTSSNILYIDNYTSNLGVGNSTGFNKNHAKITVYDSNPRMIITDSDINKNVSSAAAAADSQAVYIWAHGSDPSMQITNSTGALNTNISSGTSYFLNLLGIGTTTPDEKFEVEWSANVDVEVGRGTIDTDVTFITLRSPNGTKYYLTISDAGEIAISGTKP